MCKYRRDRNAVTWPEPFGFKFILFMIEQWTRSFDGEWWTKTRKNGKKLRRANVEGDAKERKQIPIWTFDFNLKPLGILYWRTHAEEEKKRQSAMCYGHVASPVHSFWGETKIVCEWIGILNTTAICKSPIFGKKSFATRWNTRRVGTKAPKKKSRNRGENSVMNSSSDCISIKKHICKGQNVISVIDWQCAAMGNERCEMRANRKKWMPSFSVANTAGPSNFFPYNLFILYHFSCYSFNGCMEVRQVPNRAEDKLCGEIQTRVTSTWPCCCWRNVSLLCVDSWHMTHVPAFGENRVFYISFYLADQQSRQALAVSMFEVFDREK